MVIIEINPDTIIGTTYSLQNPSSDLSTSQVARLVLSEVTMLSEPAHLEDQRAMALHNPPRFQWRSLWRS